MTITFTAVHPGCTITTSATTRCGKPSIVSFVSASGRTYHECAEHAVGAPAPVVKQPAPHPPTRTTKPFVLVAHGQIVGYAESQSEAVRKRARRLGATIVAVQR